MTKAQHRALEEHLYPGDGLEAVAVALCGRRAGTETHVLTVHEVALLGNASRATDHVTWKPEEVVPLLERAQAKGFGLLKVHSHPGGLGAFSSTDDESDRRVFESVFGWVDGDEPHGSAIMLPGGRLVARAVCPDGSFRPMDAVSVVGDDIDVWFSGPDAELPAASSRHAQLFGEGTASLFRRLRIAVVGVSGTGSIVVEQLARYGVGELVLVDPDVVEEVNLNRILGARLEHARRGDLKVNVVGEHVEAMGLGTRVIGIHERLEAPDALCAVAESDLVLGCVDSLGGRHVLSRLCRYYTLPYVDVGVKLEAAPGGGINQVAGAVHFMRPDGGDLVDRGVYTLSALEAEDALRADPEGYRDRVERGYIRGVDEPRPAVVSVNMVFSALAVLEMLSRLHPFRMDENGGFATTRLSLTHGQLDAEEDPGASDQALRLVGRGDVVPFLGQPALGDVARGLECGG